MCLYIYSKHNGLKIYIRTKKKGMENDLKLKFKFWKSNVNHDMNNH